MDNAFTAVEDWAAAQELSDHWDAASLHRKLDEFSDRYCPILKQIEESYPWSLTHRRHSRPPLHGQGFHQNVKQVRSDPSPRTKDISFFKHYREVEQRNGESVMKFARMKKTIYSLGALREVLNGANRRYLEFLSAIDDPSSGIDKLNKITRTVHGEARSYPGFNFFDQDDEALFLALARGEFQYQRRAKQSAARAFSAIQQRPNVEDHTPAAHARAHNYVGTYRRGSVKPRRSRTFGTCHSRASDLRYRAATVRERGLASPRD